MCFQLCQEISKVGNTAYCIYYKSILGAFSGYTVSKCNTRRQFDGLRYSAVSDDVVVADDDGAGFHDQHQNDAKSAVVAPF